MLGRCMSLGGAVRFPASSLGGGRSLKRPRSLVSHHHHHHGPTLFSSKSSRLQQRQQPQSVAPVAIIGAGPAGLTLSALLSQLGVPSILLERSPALPTHPQAHFINLRSMEIMRHAFGGLDRRVLEMCPPQEEWRDFVVCSTVLGRHLARVDNFREGEAERRAMSPTGVAHLSQNVLLPVLLEEAQRAAVESCPSTQIRFDAEVTGLRHLNNVDIDHDCDSIPHSQPEMELSVRRGRSPNSSSKSAAGSAVGATAAVGSPENDVAGTKILCKYVIAADGAGSSVREAVGIPLSGRRELGNLVNIHLRCKGLGQLLVGDKGPRGKGRRHKHRPGMLYFVYNEETICVLVAHNVQKGEWACQVPFFPPHQTAEFFTPERSMAIIRGALGPGCSRLDIDIRSVRPWTMNALVADSYFSKFSETKTGGRGGVGKEGGTGGEGGVILVGDAAHQFPPAGGFGLNTGVQDAHNLAWKLAAVHHGLASPDLLLSYEAERRPVAMRNAALSVRNLKRSLRVLETLGVDPSLGASVDLMNQLVHSPLTLDWNGGISNMAASLLSLLSLNTPKDRSEERSENILRLGRRQLESLRVEGHPYGESRVRALRRLLADGGGLPLLFPDHDVGFRYSSEGAAVFAGTRMGPSPRSAGAAEGSSVRSNHALLGGGGGHEPRDSIDGAVSSSPSRSPPSPPLGTLCLGGRMPHFVLRPLRDESSDDADCEDSSVPSLSTVDLPDQIRGLMLSCAGSKLPSVAPFTISGSRAETRACRARGSLASVLVVSLPSSMAVHSDDRHRPDDGTVVAAAEAARARWLSAVVAAQQPEVGGDSEGAATAGKRAAGTMMNRRTTMFRPVVVLTVSPPRRASLPTVTTAAITTNMTLPSIKQLEAYLDHRSSDRTTPVTISELVDAEARAAVAAEGPQKSADERLKLVATRLGSKSSDKTPAAGDGDGEKFDTRAAVPEGPVLSMHAIDDGEGRLGKAFAAAGAEAILLRPDGHIAWLGLGLGLGLRLDVGSELGSSGEGGECSDPVLVQELRSALDTVFPGGRVV